ncbi:unnamed protein product [Pipistrellus nathusii]|uniref:Uncharacterized protein n=1 Tax=Pipistrellus nathusii TaxID=59473 RepID=A0ABP0A9Q2_PIPNA
MSPEAEGPGDCHLPWSPRVPRYPHSNSGAWWEGLATWALGSPANGQEGLAVGLRAWIYPRAWWPVSSQCVPTSSWVETEVGSRHGSSKHTPTECHLDPSRAQQLGEAAVVAAAAVGG